jgi:hypothetical protein
MPTTDYPVGVRLTEQEKQAIRAMAEQEHRSFHNMLHVLVIEAVASRQGKTA